MLLVLILLIIVALLLLNRYSKVGIPKNVFPLAVAALLVIVLLSCFTVVPAGNVGVKDWFGNVSANTLKAGINFVPPLTRVVKFSIKTQETMENLAVPSKEGLNIQLHVSCLYHLNAEKAADVYKTVGKDYAEIIPRFCTRPRPFPH